MPKLRNASRFFSEWIPTLDLVGSWSKQDPSPYEDDAWVSAALEIRLRPFEGATRDSRKDSESAKLRRTQSEKKELERVIALQREFARAEFKSALREIPVRKKGFNQAKEIVELESNRYSQGKTSLTDLLDAEDILKDRREKRQLAFINAMEAYLKVQLADGSQLHLSL